MIALDSPAAAAYAASRLGVPAGSLTLTPLGGGVSNLVYLAEAPGLRCVLKQALGKLRVEQEWLCDPSRIHREAAALRAFALLLPHGASPRLLFEDTSNLIIAMEAAPDGAVTWKDQLLRGDCRNETAARLGGLHGLWIRESAHQSGWDEDFGDRQVFVDLRVDPYFRTTAACHPDLAERFTSLINMCLGEQISLVHGDLSPKNILVHQNSLILIDHEVIHIGHPAFDAAFLTNHLFLKAFHLPRLTASFRSLIEAYWAALTELAAPVCPGLESAAMQFLGGLMLARIDGKSPVEYLDERTRVRARAAARGLLAEPSTGLRETFARCFPQ